MCQDKRERARIIRNLFYPKSDAELEIDYRMESPGVLLGAAEGRESFLAYRGPKVCFDKPYVAFVGAAQTFGRFVEKPFPLLVGERLGVQTLNLGVGGAGPGFFLRKKPLVDLVNGACVAVVQVLSGRSASSSLFKTIDGGRIGVEVATGRKISGCQFIQNILDSPELVERYVRETQADYLSGMVALLQAIAVPAVLFWLSTNEPAPRRVWETRRSCSPLTRGKILGAFPHLVDEELLRAIRQHAAFFAMSVSERGLPCVVGNSGTKENNYYPSREMHDDAAAVLTPLIGGLLSGQV